jgi:hypothetical protein
MKSVKSVIQHLAPHACVLIVYEGSFIPVYKQDRKSPTSPTPPTDVARSDKESYTHGRITCTTVLWAVCSLFWYVFPYLEDTSSALDIYNLLYIMLLYIVLILFTLLFYTYFMKTLSQRQFANRTKL